MYVHGFRPGGGAVTCPDVIVVGSRKGMLGGRTTIFFLSFCQGLSSMHSFSGRGGAVYLSGMGGRVGTGGGK